jgi:hypothetical protein
MRLYPNGSYYVPFISDGIVLMILGVVICLVGIALSGRGSWHPSHLMGTSH